MKDAPLPHTWTDNAAAAEATVWSVEPAAPAGDEGPSNSSDENPWADIRVLADVQREQTHAENTQMQQDNDRLQSEQMRACLVTLSGNGANGGTFSPDATMVLTQGPDSVLQSAPRDGTSWSTSIALQRVPEEMQRD